MFEIIVKLMDLSLQAFLTHPPGKSDNKCKTLYWLYLAMNEVIRNAGVVIEHYLPVSWESDFLVNTKSFDTPIEKWVVITNGDFARLTQSVKNLLERSIAYLNSDCSSELDGGLALYLGHKSIWAGRFLAFLDVGTLTDDGSKLIAKSLDIVAISEGRHGAKIFSQNIGSLMGVSEFDTSSQDKRLKLVEKGRSDIQRMRKIAQQLRIFLEKNVTVEQLL